MCLVVDIVNGTVSRGAAQDGGHALPPSVVAKLWRARRIVPHEEPEDAAYWFRTWQGIHSRGRPRGVMGHYRGCV